MSLLGGAALGSALAGAVVETRGPATAFALGALPPALAALVVAAALLRRPTAAPLSPGGAQPATAPLPGPPGEAGGWPRGSPGGPVQPAEAAARRPS